MKTFFGFFPLNNNRKKKSKPQRKAKEEKEEKQRERERERERKETERKRTTDKKQEFTWPNGTTLRLKETSDRKHSQLGYTKCTAW